MRQFALALLVLLGGMFLGSAAAQSNETLGDVLTRNSVPLPPVSIPNVNSPITSYAVLNDEREFVIAYYLKNDRDTLNYPLFLTRFEKQTGNWDHSSIAALRLKLLDQENTLEDLPCPGSALSVERNGEVYYISFHMTPSAGYWLVLTRDLAIYETLQGWPVAFFKYGLVVYQGNMVHFACTHPERLFLYDPHTRKSEKIFPQRDDPLRDNFSKRLKAAVAERGGAWRKDDYCDPHTFERDISRVEVNDNTNALAFAVGFSPAGFLSRDEAEDSGKWDDDDYVYVYQLNPMRWREFSVYDLKPKFGTDSLKKLLAPEKLQEVFATPAS